MDLNEYYFILNRCKKNVSICNLDVFAFHIIDVKCFHPWNDHVKAIQHMFTVRNRRSNIFAFDIFSLKVCVHPWIHSADDQCKN